MTTTEHYLKSEFDRVIATDESILNFLRQAALDGVWYWDLENPEHEWMSREFWELFGVDPDTKDHLAIEWQDIIFKDDLQTALENFERHCQDPQHPYDQIVRYRHSKGHTIWVRCRGIAVRDKTGKPVRLLGTHTDYTALMEAQKTLDDTNLRLKTVLDTTDAGIIALDKQKQVIEINLAGRHMLGLYDEELPFVWPNNIKFLDTDQLQPLEARNDPIERAMRGETLRAETNLMTRAQGSSQRYVTVSSALLSDPKSEVHTVLVLDDVSELEHNRQQVERSSRLDALGQLTGGIAHDFNNLLATIQYALQLSLDDDLPEKSRRYLDTALVALQRGTKLTSRLLAFARRQPGLARSRPVAEVFQDMFDLIKPTIEETITLDIREVDPELNIFCDQSQLENALVNLVLNARDAVVRSDAGTTITVAARSLSDHDITQDRDNPDQASFVSRDIRLQNKKTEGNADGKSLRYVEISVTDNGSGMSREVKRRAIDPFFSTKDSNIATGLGLSTVYGFIQQSGGEMRIYSEEGQGTTIRLLLPRGESDGHREPPVQIAKPAPGNGERILVVEDEPWLLDMMEDMLQSLNYEVIKTQSSKAALEVLDDGVPFDLLLTDIVMPGGVNGFDLARLMRAKRPEVAIVYMSGYSGFSKDEMNDVIGPMVNKPCPPDRISRAIQSALSQVRQKDGA